MSSASARTQLQLLLMQVNNQRLLLSTQNFLSLPRSSRSLMISNQKSPYLSYPITLSFQSPVTVVIHLSILTRSSMVSNSWMCKTRIMSALPYLINVKTDPKVSINSPICSRIRKSWTRLARSFLPLRNRANQRLPQWSSRRRQLRSWSSFKSANKALAEASRNKGRAPIQRSSRTPSLLCHKWNLSRQPWPLANQPPPPTTLYLLQSLEPQTCAHRSLQQAL